MELIIVKSYDEMSIKAASMIINQVTLKPNSVLGLATGSTPEGLYQQLIKHYNEEEFSFKYIIGFNLDEYVGLKSSDPNSYRYYMEQHLFSKIDVPPENIHIPDGNSDSPTEECIHYENEIKAAGGIDIQILGIGRNGHIGFNEPDVNFKSGTHVVNLDDKTIQDNARFFNTIDEVPKQAISMGIKTIMSSKKIILLASGGNKAEILYKMIHGKITPTVPASILQLHNDVTVICDQEAGLLLTTHANGDISHPHFVEVIKNENS